MIHRYPYTYKHEDESSTLLGVGYCNYVHHQYPLELDINEQKEYMLRYEFLEGHMEHRYYSTVPPSIRIEYDFFL